jgi:DNA-binding transcriptional regulator YiaG
VRALSLSTASRSTVKETRLRLGLTQAELAAELLVHPMTVSRWERGEGGPSGWTLKALERLERRARQKQEAQHAAEEGNRE